MHPVSRQHGQRNSLYDYFRFTWTTNCLLYSQYMPSGLHLYICRNKKYYEQWAKEWTKITGVFTEISLICEALKQAAQKCEQNAIPASLIATSDDKS